MKTVEQIHVEIANIDEAIDRTIENYKNGIITEEELNANKIRLMSVRNALLWVIK